MASKMGAILVTFLVAMWVGNPAIAQTATTGDSKATFVLVPFEEPGNKDPHATGITQALGADLDQAGVAAKIVAPMEHLDAVANAQDLCKQNGASALLIPEGRYEQTVKSVYLFYATTVKYLTHVELRLDEIDCRGALAWTNTATSDKSRSGVNIVLNMNSFNNVGAMIDDCFRLAAKDAATHLAAAPLPAARSIASVTSIHVTPAPLPSLTSTYLLLPFEQPGIADPRAPDMTRSFAQAIAARKINVKTAKPVDHLAALSGAGALCSQNDVAAVIIPSIRVEQALRNHAELRAVLLTCDGRPLMHVLSEADIGVNAFSSNLGAALVGVSERATPALLDHLFPATSATPIPTP